LASYSQLRAEFSSRQAALQRLIAEHPGCSKISGNSDIRLIGNDFPTESKVFRRLMNDSLSTQPCPQTFRT
jgi:hypothetical protein